MNEANWLWICELNEREGKTSEKFKKIFIVKMMKYDAEKKKNGFLKESSAEVSFGIDDKLNQRWEEASELENFGSLYC